jgi:hypothetical protein
VHYNFTAGTFETRLSNTTTFNGTFQLTPDLVIPELNFTASSSGFAKGTNYEAFLKGYSTALDPNINKKHIEWKDNSDVLMRTAKFSQGDRLQVCARGPKDEVAGLGEYNVIPMGLLIIIRDRRGVVSKAEYNDDDNN